MARLFSKILCPIDLDGSAPAALELAGGIARAMGAEVHVLHVIAMAPSAEDAPAIIAVSETQEKRAQVTVLELVKKHLSGATAETRLEVGDPQTAIAAAAKRLPADLVVMATHGRRGLSRLVLGSVAESVMRRVECPLLIAKYHPTNRHTVAHWMTSHLFTASPDEPLTAACARMQQHRVRSLPVVAEDKLLGMVSDRDVRSHLMALESTTAREAMSTKILTVSPETSVWDAARLLREHKVGALPVLDGGHLAGMISTSDLLQALIESQ